MCFFQILGERIDEKIECDLTVSTCHKIEGIMNVIALRIIKITKQTSV